MDKKYDFASMYKKPQFKIDRVPIDTRQQRRWGITTTNRVSRDFTLEEIQEIIRSGDINALRELSRLYYRTNSNYRNKIDYLVSLPYYDTVVTPIFEGKGSQKQITKAFYNACEFVEQLDIRNTLVRITRAWLINGIYNGLMCEKLGKVVLYDLPIQYCRTRFKDFNNLNVLEFNITYFESLNNDPEYQLKILETFPLNVQAAWKLWLARKLLDPWVMIPSSQGGVSFCFAEDQSPALIASIPDLLALKDAVGREEKRDENELYKLLIQRMPMDSDGHLAFELDEVAEMHAGVATMLKDLDTVDVLTTFGETTLENLQDSSAASQSADRIDKYTKNAWRSLGGAELLFNPDGSSTLAYMIQKDESYMRTYLNAYATWIKFLINERFSRNGVTFDFEILPTTRYNIKDFRSLYFQSAQYGYSKMYAGVASGIKQLDQISLMTFENEYLKMHEAMIPLQSSYTSTGEDSGSGSSSSSSNSKKPSERGVGRPELADTEKSEKTQANIAAMG